MSGNDGDTSSDEDRDTSHEVSGEATAESRTAEVYDDLGFVVPASGDPLQAYAQEFEPKARRRLQRFQVLREKLVAPGQWLPSAKKADLKKMLRKGVPGSLRAEVWWSVLGCETRRQRFPGAYMQYLKQDLAPKASEEIERDLPRTFPNHQSFRTPEGRSQLRNVLCAFASYSPVVRYCQGLNFIAAVLLIVFRDEERAFWALICAIDGLGVEGYYTEGMALLRADMLVLQEILDRKCPKAADRLRGQGVEMMSVCSEWYVTWYSICLPVPTMLRVWDALFFEGFKVLFRVAVGIFRRAEAHILQLPSFDQLMEHAKEWPRSQIEHNELIKASFSDSLVQPLRRRVLVRARDDALFRVEREDEERRRRIQASRERRLQARATSAPAGHR